MSNVFNNNLHNLVLRTNYDEYWDIFVNKDNDLGYWYPTDGSLFHEDCLLAYIDAEIEECVDKNLLLSKSNYVWSESTVNPYVLHNIGYTGIDNGLIPFQRDRVDNKTFVKIYTKSEYKIEDDFRLKLHQVSGSTKNFDYPITVEEDKIKLNGGFYQGFTKTECGKYEILPTRLQTGDVWHFEFTLNKTEFEKESNKTLNDKYPYNKGIFFYLGTRAENKWAYLYNKDDADACLQLGVDDYVEGGDISKEDYKITNFIDMSLEFEDLGEVFIDDYLNFKYYSDELYHPKEVEVDDFFLDDYVVLDTKPTLIDENEKHEFVGWCCDSHVTDYYKTEKVTCTCCGCKITSENHENFRGKYLSKCDIFGDDYLEDLEDMADGWDYFDDDLDIRDFVFETFEGINIKLNQYMIQTDNKFLLFDRTCDGFTTKNWKEGSFGKYFGTKSEFKENLFLLMNRTCTGYTTQTIDTLRNEYFKQYSVLNDLYNNALAFRITDDGEIGYRYFEKDCDSPDGYKIHEAYSQPNIIKENEWMNIHVALKSSSSTMSFRFYVNGNLVFISEDLPKLNLRILDEPYEKQEGVPFNISLGGGTQGLIETILPNYMLDPYRVYPLEQYFAGSFIGYLKSFRFYNCQLDHLNINNNFIYEMKQLKK